MFYMPPEHPASVEGEWALLLSGQKKVISVAQARALGMTHDAIRWKVASGRWQRVYQGVYATFSGDLPRESRLWAVVLRCGEHTVLSHETAAEIQGLGQSRSSRIHVTVPPQVTPIRGTEVRDVVVHRTATWQADPQPWFALPRTPVAVTVLDLVEAARDLDDAYAWMSRAITTRAVAATMIADALNARKKARRRAWLEDALTDISDGIHFPLERRWTRDVERAHGLPQATRQVRRTGADGIRFLDNLYEPYRISVELDGLAFHPPEQRHGDYYRDNETAIATDAQVLRYGFQQVANRPCTQAAQLARALIKHGWDAKTLKPCKQECPVLPLRGRQPIIVRSYRGGDPDKNAR
ncbi:MAG TPA: type IV toxin-antitoxin system AbiEi family antitoxin domain-containing protein [Trebonia sp.]